MAWCESESGSGWGCADELRLGPAIQITDRGRLNIGWVNTQRRILSVDAVRAVRVLSVDTVRVLSVDAVRAPRVLSVDTVRVLSVGWPDWYGEAEGCNSERCNS